MAGLHETPSASRLHIGVFGGTNSGKSSFLNTFTGQEVSITSDVAGTTTDPVFKALELYPLGPCVFIDTAGSDDESELGARRVQKTRLTAEETDIAVILVPGEVLSDTERYWHRFFKEKHTPVLFVVSKADLKEDAQQIAMKIEKETKETAVVFSAVTGEGTDAVKEALVRLLPEDYDTRLITGGLVEKDDLIMLVMPQDIQAPRGRLILPQVQTLRELLDEKCLVMCVTTDRFISAVRALKQPPKLIITDSQVFGYVYENKPAESMLTSFSVLFAAYKGDLPYYLKGAEQIDALTGHARVLIAECCTHAPLTEDIGREKIPNLLKKRFGPGLTIDITSGTDFPQDLSGYDLIIQCGACMFNRKYVMSRIDRAKKQGVAMTNYGVTIAHLTGILDKITTGME